MLTVDRDLMLSEETCLPCCLRRWDLEYTANAVLSWNFSGCWVWPHCFACRMDIWILGAYRVDYGGQNSLPLCPIKETGLLCSGHLQYFFRERTLVLGNCTQARHGFCPFSFLSLDVHPLFLPALIFHFLVVVIYLVISGECHWAQWLWTLSAKASTIGVFLWLQNLLTSSCHILSKIPLITSQTQLGQVTLKLGVSFPWSLTDSCA